MATEPEGNRKTITEVIEVAGSELMDRIRVLLAEGRIRHIRIRSPSGELYLDAPLNVGVIAGGALALAAPWVAMVGALAAVVSRVKIEIVRDGGPAEAEPMAPAAQPPAPAPAKPPAKGKAKAKTKSAGRARPATSRKAPVKRSR
jgi:hypothetical protein